MVKAISNSASKVDVIHSKSVNKDEFNDFVFKEFAKKKSKNGDVNPNVLTMPLIPMLHAKSMHGGGYTQTDKKLNHSVKHKKSLFTQHISSPKNKHEKTHIEKSAASKNISLTQLKDESLQQIKNVASFEGKGVSGDKKGAVVDDKKSLKDEKSLSVQGLILHVKDTHNLNQSSVPNKHVNEQVWTPASAPKIPATSVEQKELPVNLNYQFNSWSGKHSVNVSGMNNAELGANVLLSPSDIQTENVLKQHKDIFYGVSSLVIDSEKEREKKHNSQQQQHNDDEEES